MDSKKIATKVMQRLSGTTKTAEPNFKTQDVKLENFHGILNAKLLPELKKEWKLTNIDITELDWDWGPAAISWEAVFPKSSGVLNVQITAPDQEIVVSGNVTYYDEGKDYDYHFSEKIKLENIETVYRKVKLGSDISPQTLEVDGKKLILNFEE